MLHFSLQNITVAPQGIPVLQNLSFEVNQGECWGLVGSSGSGKSVLLEYLSGRFNSVKGQELFYFPQSDKSQGFVNDWGTKMNRGDRVSYISLNHDFYTLSHTRDFYYQQRYHAHDSEDAATVRQYLQSKALEATEPSAQWSFDFTVSWFALDHLLDVQVIKLSNGEGKRLKLAGAMLRNPLLLLLDNPLEGLDVSFRVKFNEFVGLLAQAGTTLIMTADPDQLPESLNHVACMHQGQIVSRCERKDHMPTHTSSEQRSFNSMEVETLLANYPIPHFDSIASLHKVNVCYGNKEVIAGLNWHIAQGDHWVLSGANGSGKSTLLSLLVGDHPQAYSNNIHLFGRKRGSGESIWDIKRQIGFVSPELQQYFPKTITCIQAIESGYYDTNGLFRPSNAQKAAEALRWMRALEIERFANVVLKSVPTGVQRLCLLARAMVKKPPLFILDEPCQGLDKDFQLKFASIMKLLDQVEGLTYVYVTHNNEEVPSGVNKHLHIGHQPSDPNQIDYANTSIKLIDSK